MRVQKITLLKFSLLLTLLFMTTAMVAQNTPTVTAAAPTNVTYRTTMTITGTNFASGTTTVNFYANGSTGTTVAALATTVTSTSITVVVPAVIASGGAAATKYFSVSKVVSNTTYTSTAVAYTYTPPAHTPAASIVDRIITNYNGYWSTGTGTTNTTAPAFATNTVLPDNQHSLYAFRYKGTLYSTGSESAIANTLTGNAATGTFTTGNWRAIPVNNIAGTNPGPPVYLVLGSLIDGSATSSVYTAPSVQGLSARDVLIDGTRGLGLGTGLTNLPSTSPLTFAAGNILANTATDDVPDIIVTQVAEPTTSDLTTYCFVNAAGDIVGVPVEINMSAIAKLGTYKSDFFTLATQAFNTATVNGVGTPGNPTRDIRILAYKLSDFGITESNKAQVTQFKVLTNGSDDMAFMAYNRDTFTIPAPEISSQPTSQAVCPGGTANFSISITSTSTGTETATYQWEKNGVSLVNGATGNGSTISGATTANLTITGITAADYGIYRCVVSNSVGAAFSNSAYLNTVFLSTSTSASTCLNTATTLESTAIGNTPQYQWYLAANNGATNSNTGGTAISGATSSSYSPAVTAAGTKYYYVQSYPSGSACAVSTSAAMPVTVYNTSNAGTVTADQAICTGNTATVTITGYTGAIQWQVSANGSTFTDISGANSASYTSAALTATTYYRANVTNGTCGYATSLTSTVTVSPVSVAGTVSSNQSICTSTATSVSVSGSVGTIQWQQSANNSSWSNINGATAATYTTPSLTATTYYKAVVTSGACSTATSSAITVTVSPVSVAGTVSQDQSLCSGTSTSVSVSGSVGTIQWQQSADNSNWSNINGAIAATYTTGNLVATTYYRAVVTSGACSTATSSAVTVTVSPVSVAGTVSQDQTLCAGTATSVSLSGSTGNIQWQQSADNSNWSNINGATAATYTTGNLAATTYYRAVVTSGACSTATSSAVKVTVNATSAAGTVSQDQNLCSGLSTSVSLSGYTGNIQWQQSADNSNWSNINGATAATYNTPALIANAYYRAVVTNSICSTATSAVVTITVNTTYTWIGVTSTNWNTASNWSCNLIPTNVVDVVVPSAPANQPVVNNDGTAHARTINVNANASLTIATGGTLQVVNEVTVIPAGTFTVNNNGALVQDNDTANSGSITVKRDTNPLYRLDYTLWSAPVTGQQLAAFSPMTSTNRFYEYKYDLNSSNVYVEGYWPVSNTGLFTAGKGFLIRMPNSNAATGYNQGTASIAFNGIFKGTPNNGTVHVPMSVVHNRYTATGNPYPSPINIQAFFAENSGKIENGTGIYLWRKKNDEDITSYVTITLAAFTANQGTYLATGAASTANYVNGGQDQAGYFTGNSSNWTLSQGQGFIVKTAPNLTAPEVTFTNTMRRAASQAGTQGWFKSAASTASRLWLNLSNTENAFSQAAVAYIDGATTDLDYAYDGRSMAEDGTISLYTVAAENNLTIQARPAFDATDVVAVGYTAVTAGTYTISLDHTDGVFATGQKIYVTDKAEGIVRELTAHNYSFATEAGTFNDRFEIKYVNGTTALGTDNPELAANTVMVYKDANGINITTGTAEMTSVNIYDIRGRKLYSRNNINDTKATISGLEVQQELIIVEVNTVKGSVSKKVLY